MIRYPKCQYTGNMFGENMNPAVGFGGDFSQLNQSQGEIVKEGEDHGTKR